MDFTTPSGRMMLVMLAFFAEWYVENLRAETTKGKKERFDQGLFNGDLRFGYSKDTFGNPIPNKDAAGVVLAYELCAEGKTDAAIALLLNLAGYRTYRLIENAKKKAGPDVDPKIRRPWTKDSVCALLRAGQFYLGHIEYVGESERRKRRDANNRGDQYQMQPKVKNDTHPALITQDLYDRAMSIRSQRTNSGRAPNTRERVYLLGGGLAVCIDCGLPLRCTNAGKGKRLMYYQCPAHFRAMHCSASRERIREERLLPDIKQMVTLLELPDDWRERTKKMLAIHPVDAERSNAEQRIKEIGEELRRLAYQHQLGLVTDQELARMIMPLKAEREQLLSLITPRTSNEVEINGEQLITIRHSWEVATKPQRQSMLALLFRAIHVDVNNGVIQSYEPHPEFRVLFSQTGMIEREGRFYLPR